MVGLTEGDVRVNGRDVTNAARQVLADDPEQAPGLAGVAARDGLARSSVYQYFSSKADLPQSIVTALASFTPQSFGHERVRAMHDYLVEAVRKAVRDLLS